MLLQMHFHIFHKTKVIFSKNVDNYELQVLPLNGVKHILEAANPVKSGPLTPHCEEDEGRKHFALNLHFQVVRCHKRF